jgi:AraC-like DNA-binding protein
LFYCHGGSGTCVVNGKRFVLQSGTLVYIPAGVKYCFQFGDEMPVLSACNFDFYQDHADLGEPIPPSIAERFQPCWILEKQIFANDSHFASPIHLTGAFSLEYKFLELADEFLRHGLYFDAYCSSLLHTILIRIAQLCKSRSMGVDDEQGNAILSFIHAHYGESLTNRQIGEHFGYHENYISALIRKYTGLPLHRYVLRYRMHVAVGLLQTTDHSVSEIALRVGMQDIKHFSKCFKNVMGVPPSDFRAGLKK